MAVNEYQGEIILQEEYKLYYITHDILHAYADLGKIPYYIKKKRIFYTSDKKEIESKPYMYLFHKKVLLDYFKPSVPENYKTKLAIKRKFKLNDDEFRHLYYRLQPGKTRIPKDGIYYDQTPFEEYQITQDIINKKLSKNKNFEKRKKKN